MTNQQMLDLKTTDFRAAIEILKLVAADGIVRDFSFTHVYTDGASLLKNVATQRDYRGVQLGIKNAALRIIGLIERHIDSIGRGLFGHELVVASDPYRTPAQVQQTARELEARERRGRCAGNVFALIITASVYALFIFILPPVALALIALGLVGMACANNC